MMIMRDDVCIRAFDHWTCIVWSWDPLAGAQKTRDQSALCADWSDQIRKFLLFQGVQIGRGVVVRMVVNGKFLDFLTVSEWSFRKAFDLFSVVTFDAMIAICRDIRDSQTPF